MTWKHALFKIDSSGLSGSELTDYLAKRHAITVWWFYAVVLAAGVLLWSRA